MLIGTTCFGLVILNSFITCILLTSTAEATATAIIWITNPTPSLCSIVIPLGFPVFLRMKGTKYWSYIGTETSIERVTKLPREAAGIWKSDPSVRSSVVPCLTKRVLTCAHKVLGIKVTSHIKVSPSTRFATSTFVTVQGDSLEHDLMAALSKNL